MPAPYDAIDRFDQHDPARTTPDVLQAAHRPDGEALVDSPPVRREPFRSCTGEVQAEAGAAAQQSITTLGGDIRLVNVVRWIGDALPLAPVTLTRPSGADRELAYSPDGTLISWIPTSTAAIAGFCLILGLLGWWVRWNTNCLFLANAESADNPVTTATAAETWDALTADEQMVLLQIACEKVANPWQRPTVDALLQKGLLRLRPGLQACSPELEAFLRDEASRSRDQLTEWERINLEHSWRYVRVILAVVVAGLACFLIATQPSLQSSLLAITTGIAGALTTAMKLRDAVGAWFVGRKAA